MIEAMLRTMLANLMPRKRSASVLIIEKNSLICWNNIVMEELVVKNMNHSASKSALRASKEHGR